MESLLGCVSHNLVELLCSLVALFALEGHEHRARSGALVQVSILVVIDLNVDFAHVVELVGFDGSTSLFKKCDQFCVLKGKGGGCNLDSLGWLLFIAEIWDLG